MARRNYNIDSPEYAKMADNQRMAMMVALCVLLLLAIGSFIGLSWYFFGEFGGKLALGFLAAVFLLLLGWFLVMGSFNVTSNVYRDAMMTLVEFQSADDRGEVMRHMAKMVVAEKGLDKSVLTLAGNLAKGQAKALVDHEQASRQNEERKTIESEWWNVPMFEDSSNG